MNLRPASYRKGAVHNIGDFILIDHHFQVPLAHGLAYSWGKRAEQESRFAGHTIDIFAREVISTDTALTIPVEDRPFMMYLQGGPGAASPRPLTDSGWIAELAKSHRLILLDQRGTGRSTPLSAAIIAAQGSVLRQAEYLELFRADSIIADAEVVRGFLTEGKEDTRWSTMGQSYGGFLTLSYLSFAPQSLKDCRVTAGLAPLRAHIDDVYRHTYTRMRERCEEFYRWYPEDAELAAKISVFLRENEVLLPTGERLSDHRFQMLGNYLGGNLRAHGLHYVLESAFVEGDHRLSAQFLSAVSSQVSFLPNPLYALMHETIYADGPAAGLSPSASPTGWSAARVALEFPDFAPDAQRLLLTGEHIFPWYYREDPALRPLDDLAHLLAEKDDWGRLYDHEQLAANEVPLVAAAYVPDVYVDYEHSMVTADFVGCTRVWTSKTHHHDGLGEDGALILGHLKNLLADMH